MKIIKQGFFTDRQSKEGMHNTRKGESTEADLWYKPPLKFTPKGQWNSLFTFRPWFLWKACFLWAWCWPSAQWEISPLRMTITPLQSHAAVGAPWRRMAGLGTPHASVGLVGKQWLNLMSFCILMKKTTFQVLTNKKKNTEGTLYTLGTCLECGARDSGLFCLVGSQGWMLSLSLGVFLTVRENRVFYLIFPCSSKKPQSRFSFEKNKLSKSFRQLYLHVPSSATWRKTYLLHWTLD